MLIAIIIKGIFLFLAPYYYDEYSSLIRMSLPTYGDLIEQGIRTDGHPGGLYTFLRAYCSLFGESPVVVKLPFVLFSLCSTYLIYWLGKKWFSEGAGLLAAILLSFLFFPFPYSFIARQYAPGLMFVLLSAWAWTKLVGNGNKGQDHGAGTWKWSIVLGLFLTLSVYTHYFAGLVSGLLWLYGLFWTFLDLLRPFKTFKGL